MGTSRCSSWTLFSACAYILNSELNEENEEDGTIASKPSGCIFKLLGCTSAVNTAFGGNRPKGYQGGRLPRTTPSASSDPRAFPGAGEEPPGGAGQRPAGDGRVTVPALGTRRPPRPPISPGNLRCGRAAAEAPRCARAPPAEAPAPPAATLPCTRLPPQL